MSSLQTVTLEWAVFGQEGRADQYSVVLAIKKYIKIKMYPPDKHK